jgi:hypothetical protein
VSQVCDNENFACCGWPNGAWTAECRSQAVAAGLVCPSGC